jgi:hypothetical protein
MTVFVVILILAMLGAVGVFAARSAQLGVSNAGRYREMVQTHYVAEAGLQGAVSEFSRDPEGYLKLLRTTQSPRVRTSGVNPCQDIPYGPNVAFIPASTTCLRLGTGAIQDVARRRTGDTNFLLFRRKSSMADDSSLPGSFGMANIEGNFNVEITDERPVDPPPAGMAIAGTGGSTMKFKAVTVRAIGQIIPTDDDGAPLPTTDTTSKYRTSVETIRAEVIVGPVP